MSKRMAILLGFWLVTISVPDRGFAAETYASRVFSVDQSVYAVRFSDAGDRVALATDDGTVIFDTSDGKQVAELKSKASFVAWSPDGSMLMVGTGEALHFWRTADYSKEFATIPQDTQTLIIGLPREPFSPDGKRVVVRRQDDTAAVWQIEGSREVAILDGHASPLSDASFSPDGRRVATAAADKTLVVWDAATAKKIAKLEGHEKAIDQVSFSPDGMRILTVGRDRAVRVWDAAGGHEIATLRHQGDVEAASFDPESRRIVTGTDDGVARVFNAANGEEIATLKEAGVEKVLSAGFSPDGARVATGSWTNICASGTGLPGSRSSS
ncbi:MAG: WD40 repeat domain-containing protein [Mesorhizobium sp.]